MIDKQKNGSQKKDAHRVRAIRELRVQECLEAMKRLMKSNGNRKPTGEEVAAEMGVSRAAAYSYMSSLKEKFTVVVK